MLFILVRIDLSRTWKKRAVL